MMKKRDALQQGFSLAELIIIVGIITVVVTITLPGIQATLERYPYWALVASRHAYDATCTNLE